MDNELKPCPFCGKPKALLEGYYHVRCTACQAQTGFFPTQQEAIDAWNWRVPPRTGYTVYYEDREEIREPWPGYYDDIPDPRIREVTRHIDGKTVKSAVEEGAMTDLYRAAIATIRDNLPPQLVVLFDGLVSGSGYGSG